MSSHNWFVRNRVLILAAVVLGYGAVFVQGFAAPSNLGNLAIQVSADVVVAVGMTFLMVAGYVDLSVGSTLAGVGVVYALLSPVIGVPAGVVLALFVGAVAGGINAALVTVFRINFFIATLATMVAYQGVVLTVTGGETVSGGQPGFDWLVGTVGVGGLSISLLVVVAVVAVVIGDLVLSQTSVGRHLYAVGSSPRASSRAGISTRRNVAFAYVVAGFCAAVGGLMIAARTSSGSPDVGSSEALVCISACIIGGTSLFGGVGTVRYTFLGILILGAVQNLLFLLVVAPYWTSIVQGAVLVAVVVFDVLATRGRQRSVDQAVGLALFKDPEMG